MDRTPWSLLTAPLSSADWVLPELPIPESEEAGKPLLPPEEDPIGPEPLACSPPLPLDLSN